MWVVLAVGPGAITSFWKDEGFVVVDVVAGTLELEVALETAACPEAKEIRGNSVFLESCCEGVAWFTSVGRTERSLKAPIVPGVNGVCIVPCT